MAFVSKHSNSESNQDHFLPILLLVFIGSGCAALIYEIVWLQMLQLLIGSTAISLGVLLGTFMGGMCLGSLLLSRVVSNKFHPLLVYAVLELAIGVIGIAVWFGLPNVFSQYTDHFMGGSYGILMRGLVAGVCLLPPTLLMGATLPAIARWVESTKSGVSWLGFFYAGNIAGAVGGCLLAGFYLLPYYDMWVATEVAACINLVVAVIAILLSMVARYRPNQTSSLSDLSSTRSGSTAIYIAIGLSGMAALGAEVVWTRLLSLMLGGSVYTFSNILAVFLVGLGCGSGVGSLMARSVKSPRATLGICQLLVTGAIAWTALMIGSSMPYWPINVSISQSIWYTFQLDFVRALWAVAPGAFLWGASFPLALSAVAVRGQDPGRLVGGVYAANTIGAIFGAVLFSIWIVPLTGTVVAQQILIGISVVAALLALIPFSPSKVQALEPEDLVLSPALVRAKRSSNPADSSETEDLVLSPALMLTGIIGCVAAAGMAWSIKPVPWGLVAYGRQMATFGEELVYAEGRPHGLTKAEAIPTDGQRTDLKYGLFIGEGMNVSVAVSRSSDGSQSFHGAGKVQASNIPQDMRLQRLLGHISALGTSDPKNVLVVACGAGVTAGSFIVHPEVQRIVICDIEPMVPTKVTPMFGKENYHVVDGIDKKNPIKVRDKEVQVYYDDGRHYIRTTREMFDVITSDPIDPWVKGCAALNTVEYYQMCKDHLKDGGVMSLWIPLYESDPETAKSLISTFFQVFPNGIIWSNDYGADGYDAVLYGIKDESNKGYSINLDDLRKRFNRGDHADVRQSLAEVGFNSIDQMLATYAGNAKNLTNWSKNAKINTDRNLRLQYLAGLSLNKLLAVDILHEILEDFAFPDELFKGSIEERTKLQVALFNANRFKYSKRPANEMFSSDAAGSSEAKPITPKPPAVPEPPAIEKPIQDDVAMPETPNKSAAPDSQSEPAK